VAQVIVVLKRAKAPAKAALESALGATRGGAGDIEKAALRAAAAKLAKYFRQSPDSQDSALSHAVAHERALRTAGAALDSRALESAAAATPPPPAMRVFENLAIVLGTTDRTGIRALHRDPRVAAVTAAPPFSLIRPVEHRIVAAARGITWGIDRLKIPELWRQGLTGQGVLVGHLDTGVDGTHPALQKAVRDFAEFDLLGQPVPGAQPHDTEGHGTHTAGTIAGRPVGATRFGVAPGAELASAIVIEGGNVIARILAGLDWVVGLGVRVLSMSLGLPGYHPDFLPVIGVLRQRNILPVVATGNDYAGTSRSPGNYKEVLSVGACDEHDAVAGFSSSQRVRGRVVPDLVAPGVQVLSCNPGGRYAEDSGTSMATPHVAGLAALLLGRHPQATADQVEQAVLESCTLPAGMPALRAGNGVPDGPTALARLEALLAAQPSAARRRRR
jgi:subtilisin family serine protease